jgi:transcriptional regulator with XRE-family HTH domain
MPSAIEVEVSIHGDAVRALLADRNASATSLARDIGTTKAHLSKILTGTAPLTWEMAVRIASGLSRLPLAGSTRTVPVEPRSFADIRPVAVPSAAREVVA